MNNFIASTRARRLSGTRGARSVAQTRLSGWAGQISGRRLNVKAAVRFLVGQIMVHDSGVVTDSAVKTP